MERMARLLIAAGRGIGASLTVSFLGGLVVAWYIITGAEGSYYLPRVAYLIAVVSLMVGGIVSGLLSRDANWRSVAVAVACGYLALLALGLQVIFPVAFTWLQLVNGLGLVGVTLGAGWLGHLLSRVSVTKGEINQSSRGRGLDLGKKNLTN